MLARLSRRPPVLAATRMPKRKAATTETLSDIEESSQSQSVAKKTKQSSDTGVAANGQPTNKVLPVHISFPPRTEGTIRLASWNICGLAAAQKKACFPRSLCPATLKSIQGFKYYIEAEDPDILVLTETKVSAHLTFSFRLLQRQLCRSTVPRKTAY